MHSGGRRKARSPPRQVPLMRVCAPPHCGMPRPDRYSFRSTSPLLEARRPRHSAPGPAPADPRRRQHRPLGEPELGAVGAGRGDAQAHGVKETGPATIFRRKSSCRATQAGAQAFARLLELAETRDSGRALPLDLFELGALDIAISDDRPCCLDALRWGRADPHTLVPTRARRAG